MWVDVVCRYCLLLLVVSLWLFDVVCAAVSGCCLLLAVVCYCCYWLWLLVWVSVAVGLMWLLFVFAVCVCWLLLLVVCCCGSCSSCLHVVAVV